MEDQDVGNDHGIKKHSWTVEEESTFVAVLEELVAKGVRCDGGNFKSGTFRILAKMINERIPGCGLTARNVQNKLKRMKEKYFAAASMINQSGFKWNDTKQCVEADSRRVLLEYLEKHPNSPVIAGKVFPSFKRLQVVFGSGRVNNNATVLPRANATELPHANATEPPHNAAESPTNMSKELVQEEENIGEDIMELEIPRSPPLICNASLTSASNSHDHSRKRNRECEGYSEFFDAFKRGMDGVRQDLMTIVQKLGGDVTAKAGVAEELMKMQLTEDEQIEAGIKLMDNPQYLHLFWGFKGHTRDAFVRRVLHG